MKLKKRRKSEKKKLIKEVPESSFLPKKLSPIRDMGDKKLHKTFVRLKKIVSEVGNQACELGNEHLFDTCVVALKTMNLYSNHSKKKLK